VAQGEGPEFKPQYRQKKKAKPNPPKKKLHALYFILSSQFPWVISCGTCCPVGLPATPSLEIASKEPITLLGGYPSLSAIFFFLIFFLSSIFGS
jgi:hypothetical protein